MDSVKKGGALQALRLYILARGQKTENRRQKTEDRKQKTDDG
jgi:hypothetical protein